MEEQQIVELKKKIYEINDELLKLKQRQKITDLILFLAIVVSYICTAA